MPTAARTRSALLSLSAAALLASGGCVVVDTTSPGGGNGSAPSPGTPPASGTGADTEQQIARAIFERVNDERAERGLEPVEWSDQLAQVARDWSAAMAEEGRLEHQDVRQVLSGEQLSGLRGLGENIFTSSGPVPAGVIHTGWMRSDDHRVNVLNPGWDRLGVGVHCAPDGSVWATQEFGRTVDADRPAVAETTPPVEPIARPAADGPSCG